MTDLGEMSGDSSLPLVCAIKAGKSIVLKLNDEITNVNWMILYTGIHADVIVYIFAHLHMALRTERNMLEMN